MLKGVPHFFYFVFWIMNETALSQVFGKTAEGQKDERVISAFSTEITALFDKRRKFPLIIVAASDETDIPAELQRIFIETIHMKHLNQSKRAELISWLLSNRSLTTTADLSKVAGLCSDFKFADLLALSLHAAKFQCKTSHDEKHTLILKQEDFDRAYGTIILKLILVRLKRA